MGRPGIYARISFRSAGDIGQNMSHGGKVCACCRRRDLASPYMYILFIRMQRQRAGVDTLIFSKHLCAPRVREKEKRRARERERGNLYEKKRVQNIIKIYKGENHYLCTQQKQHPWVFTNCVHINIYSRRPKERIHPARVCAPAFRQPPQFFPNAAQRCDLYDCS